MQDILIYTLFMLRPGHTWRFSNRIWSDPASDDAGCLLSDKSEPRLGDRTCAKSFLDDWTQENCDWLKATISQSRSRSTCLSQFITSAESDF